jgi:hypothetical protein
MICIHEVIYSVCSRNFCGILSASEDFMTHDEMMSLLANTLADAAGHAGCLPILDCFSPHPGEEVTVSIPMAQYEQACHFAVMTAKRPLVRGKAP